VFVGVLGALAPMPEGAPAGADSYGPTLLNHKTDFLGGAAAYLGHAINGFFDNGGDYCYVVAIRIELKNNGALALDRLSRALGLTEGLDDVDLVAVPDAHALQDSSGRIDEGLVCQMQRKVIDHCVKVGTRVALLEALRGKSADQLISGQLATLRAGTPNATLYHPWIRTVASGKDFVPPSGQVAGVIARTDASDGVFKAPANAELQDATDLELDLDPGALQTLNDRGINCIRAFPGRGIRIWGARTLSTDSDWTYLNVRRVVLTLLRWIDLNMTWAAFEPNVPALWSRIQRELTQYLDGLWRNGALQGDTVSEAFYVRCDAELNPPDVREEGQVITEIGLAPASPAEFIVISVQHRAGTTELL
jgi:phage tail sheath protein FI